MTFNTVYPPERYDDILTISTIDFLKDEEVPLAIRKQVFILLKEHYEHGKNSTRRLQITRAMRKECAWESIPEEVWKKS
jgi:hypothetical protein